MKHFFKDIGIAILSLLVLVGSFGGLAYLGEGMSAQAAFYAVQSPATTLYAGISSSATSARLRAFNDIYGNKLTMSNFGSIGYVTFEPGVTGKEEVSSFTGITDNGDGTQTITGLTRALLSKGPTYGAGGTARSHGSNTYVVVSNSGEFYNKFANWLTTGTSSAVWIFGSTTPPRYDLVPSNHNSGTVIATTSEFASVAYVNATGAGTQVSATEAVRGEVELGTAIEQASSTATGSTGASTVMRTLYASSSPTVGCDGSATAGSRCTPVASTTGKIAQTYLPTSEAITWTGANTHSATTTFNSGVDIDADADSPLIMNGLSYNVNSVRAASSTVLTEDGSGNLRFLTVASLIPKKYSYAAAGPSVTTGSATTTLFTIPAGTMTASSTIEVDLNATSLYNGAGSVAYLSAVIAGATTTIASVSCDEGTNAETAQCNYHILVSFQSASAQRTTTTGTVETQGGVGSVAGGSGTVAIDFSNAVTLVMWVLAQNASNNINVTSLAVVANP